VVKQQMTERPTTRGGSRLPVHGAVGFLLVAVAWPANWLLPGMRTHLFFFPLWLGFCLAVDGLTVVRTGSSMITRSRRAWLGLFLVSAPAWWLFEVINWRTRNWAYLGREEFGVVGYIVLASVSFATVIPAVFGAAEWVRSFRWFDRGGRMQPWPPGRFGPMAQLVTGASMLALLLVWPRQFFPFVWISVWLLIEPVNALRGHRTLLGSLRAGDARPMLALAAGAVLCGFFWELWNFASYPKWVYDVPYVGFLHVFEMPVLGYGGYIPFAWELFALYQLAAGLLGLDRTLPRL
jgi:hypothetical protein